MSVATVPVIVHARPFEIRATGLGDEDSLARPSAFITQRSPLSTPRPRLLPKMTDVPSCVKIGVMSSAAFERQAPLARAVRLDGVDVGAVALFRAEDDRAAVRRPGGFRDGSCDTMRTSVPSAFITDTWSSPPVMNAIFDPSGDQAGSES